MRYTITVLALALLLPAPGSAQQLDVSRHSFVFLENWLDIAVLADAPGVLQVVRGSRGRVDVAARAPLGVAGYGLGGDLTRRLDLTAVGTDDAQFVVVVPEHVNVRVHLPDGSTTTMASRTTGSAFRWLAPPAGMGTGLNGNPHPAARVDGADPAGAAGLFTDAAPEPAPAGRSDGMSVAHSARWSPGMVDIPDLSALRTLDIRFEGDEFRIAASRPMVLEPGDRSRFELRLSGEPVDVVLHVPATAGPFAVQAAGVRIAESRHGEARALCGNVVIQRLSDQQTWLSFHPVEGRIECR